MEISPYNNSKAIGRRPLSLVESYAFQAKVDDEISQFARTGVVRNFIRGFDGKLRSPATVLAARGLYAPTTLRDRHKINLSEVTSAWASKVDAFRGVTSRT